VGGLMLFGPSGLIIGLMRRTRLGAVRDWRHCTFEVKDEGGQVVLILPFSDVQTLASPAQLLKGG